MKPIQAICQEAFAPYGNVIEFPEDFDGNFYLVDTEEKEPWRLAVYRYANKSIQTIECHPTSKESFEPLTGTTIILVACQETPEDYEAFLLDRPVCLKKNIWHQVLALTDEAQVKITENLEVESVFYQLEKEVGAYLC